MERERRFWHEQLQPALISAIAEKAPHQKKVTKALMIAVLDALTAREELESLCGPIARVTLDGFPSALLVALALRQKYSQERLIAFAKELRVDVKALRRQLKAARADEATPA